MRLIAGRLVPAVVLTTVLGLTPALAAQPPALAAPAHSALAQTASAAQAWPQQRYNAAQTGFDPGETALGPGNVGKLVPRAIVPIGRPFSAAPLVVADGLALITGYYSSGGQPGLIEAFPQTCGSNAGTCRPVWTATVTYDVSMGVTIAGGDVYANTVTENDHQKLWVFSLHCATGGAACKPLWTTTLPGVSLADQAPTVADGTVYVPYGQPGHAYLYAFPAACGTGCQPVWRGKMGVGADASAAVADGFVYDTDYNSYIYAFKAGCASGGGTCQPSWLASVGENGPPGVAVADGLVFGGSQDGSLYAFWARGCGASRYCDPVWQAVIKKGANILSDPAVGYGLVYVTDYVTGDLYAFPEHCRAHCQPVWEAYLGTKALSSPAVANHVVYASAGKGPWNVSVDAFSVTCATGGGTCTPLWRGHAGSYYIYSDPVVAGGQVWTAGGPRNGPAKLYVFGLPASRGQPAWPPAPGQVNAPSPVMSRPTMRVWMVSVPS